MPPIVTPRTTFSFERIGLPVPKYTIGIYQNGQGTYMGDQVATFAAGTAAQPATSAFDHRFVLTSGTTDKIFKLSGELSHFNKTCASKAKNVADTGTKILSYAGPDGSGSCTYNYSDNKDVQALTDIFQGLAETMDQGRSLDHLHRFDRLGLDAAIKFLADEVKEGHALEVGTIAPSLRSIASDPDVMERVRNRASALLALIPASR